MASPRLFKVEYSLHMTPFCSWPNCMSYVKRAKKPKQGQQEPVLLQIYKILITIQNHHQGESCNRSFMRVRSASTNLKGKWKISWKITRGHRRDQMQECRDFKKKVPLKQNEKSKKFSIQRACNWSLLDVRVCEKVRLPRRQPHTSLIFTPLSNRYPTHNHRFGCFFVDRHKFQVCTVFVSFTDLCTCDRSCTYGIHMYVCVYTTCIA